MDYIPHVKTIQIVLDEPALRAADRAAHKAKLNRSALFRKALAYYLRRERLIHLEEKHRRGYGAHPAEPRELDAWEAEAACRGMGPPLP